MEDVMIRWRWWYKRGFSDLFFIARPFSLSAKGQGLSACIPTTYAVEGKLQGDGLSVLFSRLHAGHYYECVLGWVYHFGESFPSSSWGGQCFVARCAVL